MIVLQTTTVPTHVKHTQGADLCHAD